MTLLDDDDRAAIRHNRFKIECIRMALRRQSGGPDKFVGGGSFQRSPDGDLEFVLYDTSASDPMEGLFVSKGAGAWLEAEDFWHLTGTDLRGDVWIAEWVDADPSATFGHPGAIVKGTFREISRRDSASTDRSAFRAYARTTARIPRNAWRIEAPTCGSIVATQLDDGIDVDVASDQVSLPPQFPRRLEEALTFVLSAPIEWVVEETESSGEHTITLHTRSRLSGRPRLRPPLEPRTREGMVHCGNLLNQFLAYTLANPPTETRYHPLALSIGKVLRASSLVVEDETLALSTEVERLVRAHFADRGSPQPTVLATVESAVERLADWIAPAKTKERILNAIRQLRGPSPRTALRRLVEEGLLREQHLRSWEQVRHVAAHGLTSSSSGRELVAHNDVVHQLFLLLVSDVIGYQGILSDHTVKGWPPIETPLSAKPDEAAASSQSAAGS